MIETRLSKEREIQRFDKCSREVRCRLLALATAIFVGVVGLLLYGCSFAPKEAALKASEHSLSSSSLLNESLELPAVFSRLIGNPSVHIVRSGLHQEPEIKLRRSLGGKWRRIALTVPGNWSKRRWQEALAAELMEVFYREHLLGEVTDGFELGRLSKDEVITTGTKRLLGETVADPIANAWWDVRMAPKEDSPEDAFQQGYLLFVTNNLGPFDTFRVGHISVGVRQIGGEPNDDFTLDFRAPTSKDYELNLKNFFFGDEDVINGIRVYNLWDWVHVQKDNRKVDIFARVYRLTDAQAVLLRDYTEWKNEYLSGRFRLLGNNCAALSEEFFDAILPLDQPLSRGLAPVALPKDVVKHAAERFPVLGSVTFDASEVSEDVTKTPPFVIEQVVDRARFPSFRAYQSFEAEHFQ